MCFSLQLRIRQTFRYRETKINYVTILSGFLCAFPLQVGLTELGKN